MTEKISDAELDELISGFKKNPFAQKKKGLSDIDITKEEAEKISKCLDQPDFRKLLTEYMEDITDPKNREEYDAYIRQLEQENGPDALGSDYEIVHPEKCVCLKGKNQSGGKVFINLCTSAKVNPPVREIKKKGTEDKPGTDWHLPYILAAPHKAQDRSGNACVCYDVIFHPDTISFAHKSEPVMKMVIEVSIQAINDAKSETFVPSSTKIMKKVKYMGGTPVAQRVKKESLTSASPSSTAAATTTTTATKPKTASTTAPPSTSNKPSETAKKMPKYSIVHRGEVDYSEMTLARVKGSSRPKELVVKLELPKMDHAADMDLDISEQNLEFKCKDLYYMNLKLPYPVNSDEGNAKFNRTSHVLTIVLPVLPPPQDLTELPTSFEPTMDEEEEEEQPKSDTKIEELPKPEITTTTTTTPPTTITATVNTAATSCSTTAAADSAPESKDQPNNAKKSLHVDSNDALLLNQKLPEYSFRENPENATIVFRTRNVQPDSLVTKLSPDKVLVKFNNDADQWQLALEPSNPIIPGHCRCDISELNVVLILKKATAGRWGEVGRVRGVCAGDNWDDGKDITPSRTHCGLSAADLPSSPPQAQSPPSPPQAQPCAEAKESKEEGDSDDETEATTAHTNRPLIPEVANPPAVSLKFTNAVMYQLD